MKTIIISITLLCAFVTLAHGQNAMKAVANLQPSSGSEVKGVVTFTKTGDDVKIVADIENLKPGKHGFHLHEKGDCSAADASSAGAHFNPTKQHHGGPATAEHHAGDLGNITPDSAGRVHLEWTGKLQLNGPDSIIGKSVVVHEKEDDLKTDPSGSSGARIACGVVEAKP